MENQRLAFAIVEFLKDSMKSFKPEEAESLEVACQCICDVFNVNDTAQNSSLSIKPHTLVSVFNNHIKSTNNTDSINHAQAEKFKTMGNEKLAAKDYKEAIRLYSEAIKLDQNNAVYFSNRAAAYSQMGDHTAAYEDSKKSVQLDENYSKAYSRLGLSALSLKKYQESVDAYRKAVKLDPQNANLKASLKVAEEELQKNSDTADMDVESDQANSAGNPGGFDFASMLSNPNFMNMATQMMNSGALNDLMSNPNVANMAQKMFGNNPDILKNLPKKPEDQ